MSQLGLDVREKLGQHSKSHHCMSKEEVRFPKNGFQAPPPPLHRPVSEDGTEGVLSLDQRPEYASLLKVRYSQGSDDTEQLWTRLRPRDTRADHIEQEAFTYFDEVKMQFLELPVVYDEFLDILSDYKTQA